VTNVLFLNIGAAEWGTGGKLLRVTNGVSDVEITHVTLHQQPERHPRSPEQPQT